MWAAGKSQICLHAFSHWRYMKLQNLPPGKLHCLGCTDHKEHENVTGAFCVWSPRAWALCSFAGRDKIIGCRWPAERLVRLEDVLNKISDPVKAEKEVVGAEVLWQPCGLKAGSLTCCSAWACWPVGWAPSSQAGFWHKDCWLKKGALALWVNVWRASFSIWWVAVSRSFSSQQRLPLNILMVVGDSN